MKKCGIIGLLALALPIPISTAQAQQNTAPKPATEAAKAWGHDKSDIAPDPDVIFGVLSNGMKYALRRNTTPLGGASIRLRFDVGSTAEEDDQQGLAHFLEHMAFNGSKNVPEGEMLKILERLGLKFGPHTNAATSYDETVYMLDLPKASAENLDTALMLMREVSSELTITPEAVERERGVVLEDIRLRDNFAFRNSMETLRFFLPGTPLSNRPVIGKAETIKTAPARRIRDFYERYYEPKRATLIIVGDFDPASLEAKIKIHFQSWRAVRPVPGDPSIGKIDPSRGFAVRIATDREAETNVGVSFISPFKPSADTITSRRENLKGSLVMEMLNRRMSRLLKDPATPVISAYFNTQNSALSGNILQFSSAPKGGNWKAALMVGEQELRRAVEFGFSQAELNEQLANFRKSAQIEVESWKTADSADLASNIMSSLTGSRVTTTAQSRAERQEASFAAIKLADLNLWLKDRQGKTEPLITITTNAEIAGGEQTVAESWKESKAAKLTPPASTQDVKFAHTDFGTAGKVMTNRLHPEFGIRMIRFENGVMLNLKNTDFAAKQISVIVNTDGGSLRLQRQFPGAGAFLGSLFQGGTTAHSIDQLQSIFAGRAVASSFSTSAKTYTSGATTTAEDFESQMQIFAAFVTAPGFRQEFEARWNPFVDRYVRQLDMSPGGVAGREINGMVSDNHPLMRFPGAEALKARNFEELKPYVQKALATGAIEIGVVGDFDEAAVIASVAKTFGALPKRNAKFADPAAKEKVAFTRDLKTRTIFYSGKSELSLAAALWPIGDNRDYRRTTTLNLLEAVVTLKATEVLRERLGATYTPSASSSPSSTFKNYGQFIVEATVKPENVDLVLAEIDKIAVDLAKNPISEDVLTRARKPMLESMQQRWRNNGFWLGLAEDAQSEPRYLREVRLKEKLLASLTSADIQKAAAQFLNPAKALRVKILPAAQPEGK